MASEQTSHTNGSRSGGGGCLTLIVTVIVLWAACCGVTVDGKHYDMSCSCDRGVELTAEPIERGSP